MITNITGGTTPEDSGKGPNQASPAPLRSGTPQPWRYLAMAAIVVAAFVLGMVVSGHRSDSPAKIETAPLAAATAGAVAGPAAGTSAVPGGSGPGASLSTGVEAGAETEVPVTESKDQATATKAPAEKSPAMPGHARATSTKTAARAKSSKHAAASEPASATQPAQAGWGGLNKPWPSGNTTTAPVESSPAATLPAPGSAPVPPMSGSDPSRSVPPLTPAPAPPPEPPPPPPPTHEDVTIPAGTTIMLRLRNTISTETAKPEDRVEAWVNMPVKIGGRAVLSPDATVSGVVAQARRSGRMSGRANLVVRFTTIHTEDGQAIPLNVTYSREAPSGAGKDAEKVGGGAVIGAILGGIFGGAKGAAVGAATGGGAAGAQVLTTRGEEVVITPDMPISIKLSSPIVVSVPTSNP